MSDPRKSHYQYWWQALVALPPSSSGNAYRRLERIFRDQTRVVPVDRARGLRGHELTSPTNETHLTVALWENFVLFPPVIWLSRLWDVAGLSTPLGTVRNCNWSYQWAEHGRLGARHCDIVLEYEDGAGRGILVVEAKRPGNKLGEKDLDPAYYLDIPELAAYERRSLVYLVDDAARARGEEIVRAAPFDVGFLSWVQLADLQIDLAGSLALPEEVRAFVAGSLYQTFGVRGIEPTVTPLDYLEREPPAEDVVNKRAGRTLGEADWGRPIWRLPRDTAEV